jgi:hypothetical protein
VKTIKDYEDTIDSLLSGDYFLTRPHRQKWQHVANVLGVWIVGNKDDRVRWFENKPVYLVFGGYWYNPPEHDGGAILPGTWTDEPFESRIVGPVGGWEDEPK